MWFEAAVISMLAYGVLDFLFKVAEAQRLDFSNVLLYYYWSASLIAVSLFVLFPEPIANFPFLALFALIQVSLYLLANVLKLESMKHIRSVLAYPLFALHGVMASILAILLLGEPASILQYAGIALSVAAIFLLVEKRGHIRVGRGVFLAIGAMLCLASSEVIVSAVIDRLIILPFISLSYFFAIGPSFVLEKRLHRRGGKKQGAARIGVAMAAANITAFYLLLYALGRGPASVIFPIIALALLVSVALSKRAYGEKLTAKELSAILIALAAIILMRL